MREPVRPTVTVALLGALDTKADEYAFVRDLLSGLGCAALLVDTGVLGVPGTGADIGRQEVARAAGHDLDDLRAADDRGAGMTAMAAGAAVVLGRLHAEGRIAAVMAIGGSNAAYVMSAACAGLPIGFPKLLVSTMAAGDTRPYVGNTDLTLMYPVVDINGLNRISKHVLTNAASACAGMALATYRPDPEEPEVVAISMFGVTTACGTILRECLTSSGIEALTFHATGVGGRTMEALIRGGHIQGVADVTTTELADELVGGVCSAGPDRLTAAAETGIPQVVSLGALDMVNFGARATVPKQYADRLLYPHNPEVTLMRTSAEECAELGRRLATKLNASVGRVAVLIPTAGLSQISTPGQAFHDPVADAALVSSLTAHLDSAVLVHRFDTNINDPRLATTAARILTDWMRDGNHA